MLHFTGSFTSLCWSEISSQAIKWHFEETLSWKVFHLSFVLMSGWLQYHRIETWQKAWLWDILPIYERVCYLESNRKKRNGKKKKGVCFCLFGLPGETWKKSLFKIRFRLKRTSGKINKTLRHYLKKKVHSYEADQQFPPQNPSFMILPSFSCFC